MQQNGIEHRRLLLKFLLGSPLLGIACGSSEQKVIQATPSLDDLITRASDAINIFDFEKIANQKLPPAHLGYLTTGVRDNITRDANQEAYKGIKLSMRRLVDTRTVDMGITLFGKKWPTPLFLSPLSSQHAFHEDGELATARAAKAKNHLQILSTVTTESVEDVSRERGEPVWYQLYPLTEWEGTLKMIQRAEAAGSEVLVVTVDLVGGTGNRETLERMSRIDTRTCANCHSGNRFERKPMMAGIKNPEMDRIVTWEMLDKIKASTKMKVMVKGIERAEDAALCVERGMDGIIVSNHGGRASETGRGTIEALPEIAAVVKKRIPVLIDGGVRRGTDIFKALALGADAVGIGRPYIWGLTAFGQEGVEAVLNLLVKEFESTMQQAGTRTVKEITRNYIA
jgi:isopentenyl diphosphate isomerase/L-lactate dehydrogenase-like FMN-dependent dehydrogenase